MAALVQKTSLLMPARIRISCGFRMESLAECPSTGVDERALGDGAHELQSGAYSFDGDWRALGHMVDRPTHRHFPPGEFRRHMIRNMRAEALAVADYGIRLRLAAGVFADGDELHFRRDDTGARIGKLGAGLAILCA